MNKIPLKVPKGIKFISQWEGYRIPEGKCIIDKKVCGCGYTQFCLTNSQDDIILCSPRKSLLENKAEQNLNCHYFRAIDRIPAKERKYLGLKTEDDIKKYIYDLQYNLLSEYISDCYSHLSKIKILVTYDSLPKLILILSKIIPEKRFVNFKIIVDEFQLIFNDAKFKANIELDFVEYLTKYCKNVVYLSGTPMIESYLECLPEFNSLDYYELIWDESIISPVKIKRVLSENLEKTAIELINIYREGKGPIKIVDGVPIQSKEAVLFVNNVSMITSIIKGSKLTPDEVNIITAKTSENLKKIKKCGKGFTFGSIPILGKKHKLITICSSTAYCGVDMYSETAKSYVFSSCNLKTMTVDISLELPQIVGRQRLESNPFRKEITIYYSDSIGKYTEKQFQDEIKLKTKTTFDAIHGFEVLQSNENVNIDFERKRLRLWISEMNYTEDYTSISKNTGLPVFNNLMRIADIRSWELQNKIYNNEKEVIHVLSQVGTLEEDTDVFSVLEESISEPLFEKRLEKIKNYLDLNPEDKKYIPDSYLNYVNLINNSFRKDVIDKKIERLAAVNDILNNKSFIKFVHEEFIVDSIYTKKEVKEKLNGIVKRLGYNKVVIKSNLLFNYFNISEVRVTNIETKKRDAAYRILSIKSPS